MTTYAIADQVPPACDYITAGKEYEVTKEVGVLFKFYDDFNDWQYSAWVASGHLNGGNWRRVERD